MAGWQQPGAKKRKRGGDPPPAVAQWDGTARYRGQPLIGGVRFHDVSSVDRRDGDVFLNAPHVVLFN
jgi:hypothetical protein